MFFAAGVGIVQTMRADGRDPADVAREEAERGAASAAAKHPWRFRPPRLVVATRPTPATFPRPRGRRSMRDDTRDDATRGERRDGRVPRGDGVVHRREERATPARGVAASSRRSRRAVTVALDVSGERLATVCGDDGHTVTLWEWNAGGYASRAEGGPRVGRMLWSARVGQTTPPAVRGILFTPSRVDPDLFVTFGTTHARFWRPEAPVPVSDGDVGSAEAAAAARRFADRGEPARGKNVRVEGVCSGVFLD